MKNLEIIIATGNKDKVKEYKELFKNLPINITSLKEEGINLDVEETGTTFIENALIKARYVASKTNKIVISDDSGISVHALDNFPGIYSSRFMENHTYQEKNLEINRRLEGKTNKSAHYTCAIAFVNKGIEKVFEGICNGYISSPQEGEYGFGYDPIFVPEGETKTFSQLTDEEKNSISHRGRAFKLLVEYLNEYIKNS